jgi:hypothetical protein
MKLGQSTILLDFIEKNTNITIKLHYRAFYGSGIIKLIAILLEVPLQAL